MEKHSFHQYFWAVYFSLFLFFGGGGGQITASFTCGSGLTEIIGDFTCWWLSFVMFKARIFLLVDLGTLLL